MGTSTSGTPASPGRRRFLLLAGAALAAGVVGIPLLHLRPREGLAAAIGPRSTPKLDNWQDLYRQRWTWDKVVKGSHGWANCRSACEWDLYVKDGIVVREEQSATYEQSEPGVPTSIRAVARKAPATPRSCTAPRARRCR